jgi:hypothetical protein
MRVVDQLWKTRPMQASLIYYEATNPLMLWQAGFRQLEMQHNSPT